MISRDQPRSFARMLMKLPSVWFATEHETENTDRNDDTTQTEVPDCYQENKQQLENFCSTLKAKMEPMLHSWETMKSLQKAKLTLFPMHSGPQILSALHAFGKTSAV